MCELSKEKKKENCLSPMDFLCQKEPSFSERLLLPISVLLVHIDNTLHKVMLLASNIPREKVWELFT